MRVDLQRTIDRVVGRLVCAFLSVFAWFRRKDPGPDEPRSILIILLSEMGSLVLARPMFDRLREQYPDASLHALVFAQNREVLDVQGVMPPENVVTIRNDGFLHLAWDSLKAVRRLRKQGIDVAIDCELFARVSAILSYLSGARIRVGFDPFTQEGLYRGRLVNRPVLYNPYQHMTQQFTTLADAITSDGVPTCKRVVRERPRALPQMTTEPGEIEAVRERLVGDFPVLEDARLVLVSPAGGLLPIRAWPMGHYVELVDALLADGFAVGVMGLERDREVARELIDGLGAPARLVDLTGWTRNVRELMLLFHHAELLIANDGGPGHFAALTPMPSIVLFGPETPVLYGTVDEHSVNIRTNLACSPCLTAYNHRASPCDGNNVCLQRIEPAVVLGHARGILTGPR